MRNVYSKWGLSLAVGTGLVLGAFGTAGTAHAIKKGGILNFVVGSKIPSYDLHRETTFGVIHPIRPFYSLLIRINPDNPSSPTDFICDLCEGDVPKGTDGFKTYTFKIRTGVKFHDGTPLTAADIVATYNKIIFPPKGIPSARKAFFKMVDSISAPNDTTVVFKLKFPSGSFIPAVATPFNIVMSAKDLARTKDEKGNKINGFNWHKKNINGTGAFSFVQHQPGSFVEGKKYDGYHFKGKPYLDGFKAIAAPKMAVRLNAIRGDRASIEFRGFPPKARDDLVKALGDKVTVQESDWNCALFFTPNQERKPFGDARVKKALSLAIDRWGGSKYLQKIAIVGGGGYIRSTPDNSDIHMIYDLIEQLSTRFVSSDIRLQLVNRYQWPLAVAIFCFAAEGLWLVLLPHVEKRRSRKVLQAQGEEGVSIA